MSVQPFSATAPVKALAGSNTEPSITFTGDTDTGLYSPGANQVAIATGGVQRLLIGSDGSITPASPLRFPVGTATAPSISFNGDTNTGIYSPGADQVAVATSGAGRLLIDSSGVVDIYNATPKLGFSNLGNFYNWIECGGVAGNNYMRFATANIERLRITSAGLVGVGTSAPDVLLDAQAVSGNAKIQAKETTTNKRIQLEANTAYHAFYADGAVPVYHYSNGSIALTIDSSQRVGVGTTDARGVLRLAGSSANAFPNNGGVLWFTDTNAATDYKNWSVSSINGDFGVARASDAFNTAQSAYKITGSVTQGYVGEHIWYTNNSSEKVRIDNAGRLLVGTSSSSAEAKFIVQGGATAAGGAMNIQRNVTTASAGSTIGYIGFTNSANNVGATISADGDGTWSAGTSHPTLLKFSTTKDGQSSPTEACRIDSSQRLLVGTSDATGVVGNGLKIKSNGVGTSFASGALCVQGTGGDFYAVKFADQDMGILSVTSGSVDNIQIGGSVTTAILYSNGSIRMPNVGTTASAANVYMDSANSNQLARSTSSLRYKTNVEDLEPNRADAALALRPVWYRSKADADRKDWSHYGLIAEEVAKIEPRLVNWTYLEDDYVTVTNEYGIESKELKPNAELVPDGVQYERLPVLLLSVIQRQEKRIETLEAKVAALESA